MRPLIFVGSRSHMSDLALAAEKIGHEVLGILDHQYHGNTVAVDGIPVIGDENWLAMPVSSQVRHWRQHCDFFVATLNDGQQQPGSSGVNRERLRYQRISLVTQLDLSVASLIDPDSGAARNHGRKHWHAQIGRGCYVAPTADIANSVVIGDWCVIERHTFVGHHCELGSNTAVLPTSQLVSVTVGSNVCIGYGAETRRDPRHPRYHIGDWSTIWSHAWIDRDVPPNHILTHHGRLMTKQRKLDWLDTAVDQ